MSGVPAVTRFAVLKRIFDLLEQHRPEEALRHLDDAMSACSSESEVGARLFRASWLVNALLGDWPRAFASLASAYRLIWPASVEPPMWRGERVSKRLLVLMHALQSFGGFGDVFLFARYLRSLAARAGGLMTCGVPSSMCAALQPLMTRLGVAVVGHHELPEADAWLPLELAPLYATPAPVPYIPAVVSSRPPRPFTVAICWAGALRGRFAERRTVPASAWSPILRIPGVRFVSVQQRRTMPAQWHWLGVPHELGIPPRGVDDLGPALPHWAATADVLAGADLVISSDTAVAHLGGALGRPVWILLSEGFDPSWSVYWERGDRIHWYPTARLFRQERPFDWAPVMHRVAAALETLVSGFVGNGAAACGE